MKLNTFIIPIIRSDFIGRMLETLEKHTPPNYNVIVIDQTEADYAYNKHHQKASLWIKSYRNMGFSKAMNTGIRLADTKYITLANDDIEFMDQRWWQGIVDTFALDQKIIAVNPMSPKEATWGYGYTMENKETWQPNDSSAFANHQDQFIAVDNKEGILPAVRPGVPFPQDSWTKEDYTWLLEQHPVWKDSACIDAVAMWCTVFKKTGLDEIGLLEERFYPGGGEDYDMNARAYSCAYPTEREECDPDFHRRMVATSKSWVWHHWGKSRDEFKKDTKASMFASRAPWNSNESLWEPEFDVWGHYHENGVKKPIHRVKTIGVDAL